jgi:AcrR family transcriptional regulator
MRTSTKAEATVHDILNAAENLFVEKNYADVSMAEIAYLANVTKGALYHHFKSKEDLYVAMLLRDLDEKRVVFQQAVDFKGDCRSRLILSTKLLFQMPSHKQKVIRLVRRDINVFKGETREQLVRAYQMALPESVEAIIRDGIANGELAENDPRLLSWGYVAMVEVVLSNYAQQILGGPEQCVEHAVNLFFQGAAK